MSAQITITIDPFTAQPVALTPTSTVVSFTNCQPRFFAVSGPDSGRFTIQQPAGDGPSYVPGNISIKTGDPIVLTINVIDSNNGANSAYIECGLTFNPMQGNTVLPGPARNVFPPFVVGDRGLSVTDNMMLGSFEYLILFQNSNGAIAVVDPRITNTA